MKVVAIISEYNPFHSGHEHQIREIRKKFSNRVKVLSLMSSNFVQRGEPALVDKYTRAKMASKAGADLVLEYPSFFCVTSAESFAQKAIYILNKLNCVDYICYGSESNNPKAIRSIAKILVKEPEEFKENLKTYLKEGFSFPKARHLALEEYFRNQKSKIDNDFDLILSSSNDILGIEYEKALILEKSKISSFTIKRVGSDYKDNNMEGSFSSAGAIRKLILENENAIDLLDKHQGNIPKESLELLKAYNEHNYFGNIEAFKDIFVSKILTLKEDELRQYPLVNEGIENLLKKKAPYAKSLEELVSSVSGKRYPKTRIQRLLIQLLLDITKESLELYPLPLYIRALSFKDKKLLSLIEKKSDLPLVTSLSKSYKTFNSKEKALMDLEIRSSDLYYHFMLKDKGSFINEFSQKPDF